MNLRPDAVLPEAVLQSLAACVDSLGSTEFYPCFFHMMRHITTIDQYMVFEFSPNGEQVECRLAHNAENPQLGVNLATAYVGDSYLSDPLLQELRQQLADPNQQTSSSMVLQKRALPASYRQKFFNVPDFDSKFAFVVLDERSGHLFYINFYSHDAEHFSVAVQDQLNTLNPVIASLLLKHFKLERRQLGLVKSLLKAGLSKREAQICDLIQKGHTAKTIAKQLAIAETSVITYKKRAFQKLNIGKKSELISYT